jgi:hypothetical protein
MLDRRSAINYPAKVNIGVLSDVLRAFEDMPRPIPGSADFDPAIDLRFVPLADALMMNRSVIQNGVPTVFTYEEFVWAATVKHTVMQKRVEGVSRYVYIVQLILPSDSHVFKDGAVNEADPAGTTMSAKSKRTDEVVPFFKNVARFVQKVTGLTIQRGRDVIAAEYDEVEQRASFSVTFDKTREFVVAWEYGTYQNAEKLSEEEIAFMEAHQDDIFSVLEASSSTAN